MEIDGSSAGAGSEVCLPGETKTPGSAVLSAEPVLLPRGGGEVLLTQWVREERKT
jgi:hypothetical protein